VFCIVGSDIRNAKISTIYCWVSMATLSTFITLLIATMQGKGTVAFMVINKRATMLRYI
jgi:hypothetical protein